MENPLAERESPTTTHLYIETDLAMKENAPAKTQEPGSQALRFYAPDALIQFLKDL